MAFKLKRYYDSSDAIPPRIFSDGAAVYVLLNPVSGFIKIGISKSPRQRVVTLECQGGVRFSRIFISEPFSNPKMIERNLHERFAEHRRVGEWFALDFKRPMTYICRLERLRDKDKFVDRIAIMWPFAPSALMSRAADPGASPVLQR